MVSPPAWKGKEKVGIVPRQISEGNGGPDGIVLPLDAVGSGFFDIAYTIPMRFSHSDQNLSVQVDTGSSDLWVASTSCSSSVCGQTGGRLYNPSSATDTGEPFTIKYLQGTVSGPIVWERVELGGYSIEYQAIAAANDIANEPLSPKFSGILGLALPLNSVIAVAVPPVTSNDPDGAAFGSNLFSITPSEFAPAARFFSLSLSRPGSDRTPSLLGIGRHPSQFADQASQIGYSSIVAERMGSYYWKAGVRAITVYADGEAKPVNIGRSNTGAVFPSAVLDSGVPLILTTSALANAIYGAIGVSPASDGQYYVPCSTPLNITITLDNRPEIPLHPLDLTAEPPQDNNARFCIGLIQAADSAFVSPELGIGDMVLGVPFLRNTYSVMAYDIPNQDGSFPSALIPNPNSTGDFLVRAIQPRLGLLSLTDPDTAMDEFKRVRLLNQPLGSPNPIGGGTAKSDDGGKKMSVGIIVLIGLVGFFALCFSLFALRYFFFKRKYRKQSAVGSGSGSGEDYSGDAKVLGSYQLTGLGSRSRGRGGAEEGEILPSEDELRKMRFEAYMKKERMSEYTVSSGQTQIVDIDTAGQDQDRELGFKSKNQNGDGADPLDSTAALGWGDDTLVAGARKPNTPLPRDSYESSPERSSLRQASSDNNARGGSGAHDRTFSAVPLLTHVPDAVPRPPRPQGEEADDSLAEFGFAGGMAGVGTALRGSKIDISFRQSMASTTSAGSAPGTPTARGRPSRVPSGPRLSASSFNDTRGHLSGS